MESIYPLFWKINLRKDIRSIGLCMGQSGRASIWSGGGSDSSEERKLVMMRKAEVACGQLMCGITIPKSVFLRVSPEFWSMLVNIISVFWEPWSHQNRRQLVLTRVNNKKMTDSLDRTTRGVLRKQ